MRKFEKISYKAFEKEVESNKKLYESYNLPVRKTKHSAGYDFELIEPLKIKPNEIKIINTGIKACMNDDEVLLLIIRSSLGFKYNIRLTNQVGVIDSDYYNNENNEGHIKVSIQNHGEKIVKLEKKDAIVQGIFTKFLTIDEKENIYNTRKGGFGSTKK